MNNADTAGEKMPDLAEMPTLVLMNKEPIQDTRFCKGKLVCNRETRRKPKYREMCEKCHAVESAVRGTK